MANIPGTNVPAIDWGPTGFVIPSAPLVLAGVQADINAAFKTTLNYALTTPQGQLATTLAALINNFNALFVYYTNQVNPSYASGRMQDAIGKLYFLPRNASQSTTLQLRCSGLDGLVIPVGALVQDSAGNLYAATEAGAITGGSVTLPFDAKIPGPTSIPATVTIYQSVSGWDAATVVSGVVGRDVESQAQYEERRARSVAKNSVGSLGAILGEVLDVDNVTDAYVTENDTSAPLTIGGVTLVAKSIYVAAVGGDDDEVAAAVWRKKAPGSAYNGNTTVIVLDQNSGYTPPYPSYTVKFQRPDNLAILFGVSIPNSTQVPSDALAQIRTVIGAAFVGDAGIPRARLGSVIYAAQYAAPIAALGTWAAAIISLQVGSNNTAGAVVNGRILATVLTVTRVVSGTLAVGQTISGPGIAVGTTITSFGTGTGGTGTYNVSQTQTVSGATFTGSGSGTNLTASSVTGTINIGDVISGTGVPTGTTIVSQTSGTAGGAGVYVTSAVTTSVAQAITCGAVVTAALPDRAFVSVGIGQEPTFDPADIYLTLV